MPAEKYLKLDFLGRKLCHVPGWFPNRRVKDLFDLLDGFGVRKVFELVLFQDQLRFHQLPKSELVFAQKRNFVA